MKATLAQLWCCLAKHRTMPTVCDTPQLDEKRIRKTPKKKHSPATRGRRQPTFLEISPSPSPCFLRTMVPSAFSCTLCKQSEWKGTGGGGAAASGRKGGRKKLVLFQPSAGPGPRSRFRSTNFSLCSRPGPGVTPGPAVNAGCLTA